MLTIDRPCQHLGIFNLPFPRTPFAFRLVGLERTKLVKQESDTSFDAFRTIQDGMFQGSNRPRGWNVVDGELESRAFQDFLRFVDDACMKPVELVGSVQEHQAESSWRGQEELLERFTVGIEDGNGFRFCD